jgi:hypothetical protein
VIAPTDGADLDLARAGLGQLITKPKYGDGIEWKLKQDVDFLRDA